MTTSPPPPRPSLGQRLRAWLRRTGVSVTSGRAAGLAAGMLDDRDADALMRAAGQVASSRDARALPYLLEAMRENPEASGAVRASLAGIGAAAVEPLLRLLTAPEVRLRDLATDTLGDIGDPRAASPLADIVRSEAVEMPLRKGALIALSRVASPQAQDAVCEFARTAAPQLRDLALLQLAETRSPRAVELLTETLRDASFAIRSNALAALGKTGWTPTSAEERFLAGMASQAGVDRAQASDASSRSALLALARDMATRGDAASRARAADALEWLGGDEAIDALVRLAADAEPSVQVASIGALARTRLPRALSEVARRLADAADTNVFAAAARALGMTGDARWTSCLAEAYADIDPNPGDPRKWAAAEGLLGCGDPRPATWLLAVTADEDWAENAVRLLACAMARSGERIEEETLTSLASLSGVRQRTKVQATWDDEERERAGLPEFTDVPCDDLRRLAREALARRRER